MTLRYPRGAVVGDLARACLGLTLTVGPLLALPLAWPALVALCDISGSMASYSRMLLHFLHAAANAHGAGWSKVSVFTFGTRLTNITRHLAHRDVD